MQRILYINSISIRNTENHCVFNKLGLSQDTVCEIQVLPYTRGSDLSPWLSLTPG